MTWLSTPGEGGLCSAALRSGVPWGKRLASWLSLVAALGSAFVAVSVSGCKPTPAPAFGSGLTRVPASVGVHRQERQMFERLNRDRRAKGLSPLRFDERLSEVARHHSADMRDHGFFEHESPRTGGVDERLDAAGYVFLTARENLSEAPDVERSQDGLLASPPHYANIMASDITHVGIGIVEGGVVDPRNITTTQVFARPAELQTPERATSQTLERIDRERRALQRSPARRNARLMELASKHLQDLDEQGSQGSVERAGQGVVQALEGAKHEGNVMISVQVVPSAEQVALPAALLEASRCEVGLAMRRVKGERGRPSLQLLLLVEASSPQR